MRLQYAGRQRQRSKGAGNRRHAGGSRDILGGADWVQEQAHTPKVDVAAAVEKGKSAFAGPELYKKTLGVIGLGAIGALVANIALSLGMDVYGYDPFLSVDAALRLDRHIKVVKELDVLFANSDYITLHLPYMEATKDTVNAAALGKMRDGCGSSTCPGGTCQQRGSDCGAAIRQGGPVCHGLSRQ